jgi:translocation and assembly module TamB
MMKNRLVRFIIFVVIFSFSLIVLLAGVSMTQSSSRWFVNWLVKTNDIPLTIEKIEGRLIDTVSLNGLHYKDKQGNEFTLDKLVFDWSPAALLSSKAQINHIDLENLNYQYKSDNSSETIDLPEITLPSIPVAVSIDEFNIKNTRLLIDDIEKNIKQFNSSLSIDENGLVFQLEELISEQQTLSGHVALGNKKRAEMNVVINWKGELKQQPGQALLTIKGPQNKLVVSLEMDSVIKAKVNGSVNLKDKPYHAVLNGELSGKLLETYSDQLIIDAPVVFNLDGDMNHVAGLIKTHAHLASGEGFSFNLETDAALPGEKYDSLNINVEWESLPDLAENMFLSLKGLGDFKYDNQILHIDHDLQAPATVSLKGDVNFVTESLDLLMQWDELSLPVSDTDLLSLHTGIINARGKLDALTFDFDTKYLVSDKSNVDKKTYDTISAEGIVNLLAENPVVDLNGTLRTSVPESLQEYVGSIGVIDFTLRSETGAIKINAKSDIQSEQLGSIHLDLNSQWNDSVLNLESLSVDILGGKLEASGALNIQNKTQGTFNIIGHHLNIGVINPDLVSQLDLNADVVLSETEKGLSTEIELSSLSGEWRGLPITGSARLVYADDIFRIEKLDLGSGSNTVAVNLNVDKLLNGFIDLSIQDLSLFSSELAGAINGRMEISGNIDTPTIEGKLNGNNIFINDVRIASLTADSSIDLRPKQHSSIKLKVITLRYKDYVFDDLLINGEGLTESHKFEIIASGSDFNINAVMNAGLNNKLWSGQLAGLNLTNKDTGLWQLSSPSNYTWQVHNSVFDLQKTCLSQNEAHLCITAKSKSDGEVNGDIDVNRLPLKFVEPMILETILLKGDVSGDVKFHLLDNSWTLVTELEGRDTRIGAGYEDEPEFIDIDVASFKLNANKDIREFALNLSSKDYFDINLTASMHDKKDRPIEGKLDLFFEDIKWLENIEPALSGSYGKFQANMIAGGTIHQPVINGNFFLDNGVLNVLPIGLSLDKVKGKIESNNATDQIQINSSFTSKEKELLVNGLVRLSSDKNYPYELEVKGENFPLIRTADVTMDVSPEIKLSGTKDLHYVRGDITVPLLDMLITSLPESAVSVSPDVVIIQSKQADAVHVTNGNGGNNFVKNHIDLDVNVFLKPDIHIEGFGLDTRLTGDIKITKPVGVYQPRGEGSVTLTDGSYQAYGQDLVVESGRLLFAGPLGNPGINLRAYRPKLAVKAGVSISGDVRQPKLSLFSEPTQSEADTLSYLITGGPISGASSGEANLIAQAALSLGTRESSVLTNQIRDMFGLDDLSIGGGGTVASTSVSASKRLSPKLTFKSSFNPFDQLWAFFLNYKLTENWSVQTESGVSQGADLIYSIESNTFSDLLDRFLNLVKF